MPSDYSAITESPGLAASNEQRAMLVTRYALAAPYAKAKDVLEVACGTGIGLGYLATHARLAVGGDITRVNVEQARRVNEGGVPVLRFDAQTLPFHDESFDLVLLYEAIYYLADAHRFMAEAHRVLRRGGRLVISTANRERRGFVRSPYSTRYLSASELRDAMASAGFSKVEVHGGFPVDVDAGPGRVLSALASAADALRLVPRSLEGRAKLKRFLGSQLTPLDGRISEGTGRLAPLVPIRRDADAAGYKVLYAIGAATEVH